jgi:hypothetical protein
MSIEAMRQALDALERHKPKISEGSLPVLTHDAAITALRVAIEHYDQTALELCKECGWKALIPGDGCLVCARQTAQEPKEWVGLTGEEINAIYVQHHNQFGECISGDWGYERDIEAKLKEKNHAG